MGDTEPPSESRSAIRSGPTDNARDRHRPGGSAVARRAWPKALRAHRYLILLLTLICALLVQSIDRRLIGLTLLADLVVGISAFAVAVVVFDDRKSQLLSLWWGGAVVVLGWTRYLLADSSHSWLELIQKPLQTLFFGWAAAIVLRDVFRQERIRTDDVVGAVAGYLLAAGAWGSLYIFCDALSPGLFHIDPELATNFAGWHGRAALFNYFSLATITSVGYGDVVPVRGPMTVVAMLETVFGQFYIAVVVAQIVGMHLAQGPRGRGEG
jgi:hypothetical protein